MPLNRPALTLGSGPRGVHDARRLVVQSCVEMERPELVECAEYAVSELVTNALLHGEHPISVRVRGTREHPRVEVRDASQEPPVLPGTEPLVDVADEDILMTFGRGLDIVARCSTAWGAEIEDDGKVVWFVPADESREDGGVAGVITGQPDDPATENGEVIEVEIRDASLRAILICQTHCRELYREVRLLSLAHESQYPLAKSLSDLFGSLDRLVREGIDAQQLEAALAAGQDTATLTISVPRSTIASIGRFLELLELADAFCREERLLSLARSPEQRLFQEWFFGEFVRQLRGDAPVAWSEAATGRTSVG